MELERVRNGEEPMEIIQKVAFTPVIAGKIPFARTHGKEIFYNLGGKPKVKENGQPETLVEALTREVKEESSADVLRNTLNLWDTFFDECDGKPQGTWLRLWAFEGEFAGVMVPQKEIAEIRMFDSRDGGLTTKMGRNVLDSFKRAGRIK